MLDLKETFSFDIFVIFRFMFIDSTRQTLARVGERVQKWELSYVAGGDGKWYSLPTISVD